MAGDKSGDEYRRVERSRGGFIIGLVLISLGAILLIDNIFPGLGFGKLWPVVIIAWGFAVLISGLFPPFSSSRLFSGALIGTIGIILIYNTLAIVPFSFWLDLIALWPVLLIAIGFSILGGVTQSRVIAAIPSIIVILTLILALVYHDVIFRDGELNPSSLNRGAIPGVRTGSARLDFSVGNLDIGATDKLYDIF